MPVKLVLGVQWGDEGKGKIIDVLAQHAEIVGRFNGGDNTGHTVVTDQGTFRFRLVPAGILNPHVICVIGPGVIINLGTLNHELAELKKAGVDTFQRLWISPRCHVVMPYHELIESIYEAAKGDGRTDTTRRGTGPAYADKVSYNGIRLCDFLDAQVLADKSAGVRGNTRRNSRAERKTAWDNLVFGFGSTIRGKLYNRHVFKDARAEAPWMFNCLFPQAADGDMGGVGELVELLAFERMHDGNLAAAASCFDYAATCFYLTGHWNAGEMNEWAARNTELQLSLVSNNPLTLVIGKQLRSADDPSSQSP